MDYEKMMNANKDRVSQTRNKAVSVIMAALIAAVPCGGLVAGSQIQAYGADAQTSQKSANASASQGNDDVTQNEEATDAEKPEQDTDPEDKGDAGKDETGKEEGNDTKPEPAVPAKPGKEDPVKPASSDKKPAASNKTDKKESGDKSESKESKEDTKKSSSKSSKKKSSKKSSKKKASKKSSKKSSKKKASKKADKKKDAKKKDSKKKDAKKLPSSGNYVPHHYSRNLTTEKFIAVIGEQARQVGQERDLYASVMIAQAILESGSGNSGLAQAPNNNLFGIKGTWRGQKVNMLTKEDNGSGVYYTIAANFRKYDTIKDSLEDYANLLTDGMGGFYKGAWKSNAKTPAKACDFLQGRYATSTRYSASLQDLIATYNLTRFDKPADYQLSDEYQVPQVDTKTGKEVVDKKGNTVMETPSLADLVAETTKYLGTEYVWGGASPKTGFDCSGLVQYCYKDALGIDIPRVTQSQWRKGKTVKFSELIPGDLLFFEDKGDVHHVAMYLGDGFYIHAPQTGDVVKVTAMDEFKPSFARRIVKTESVKGEKADDANKTSQTEKKVIKVKVKKKSAAKAEKKVEAPAAKPEVQKTEPAASVVLPFVNQQAQASQSTAVFLNQKEMAGNMLKASNASAPKVTVTVFSETLGQFSFNPKAAQ